MSRKPGDVLRIARERIGKTQQQIADECKVTQPMVCRWEAGDAWPTARCTVRAARAYGLSVEWFLRVAERRSA